MTIFSRLAPHILAVFSSVIFLDSLRFKFTDHPNTQEIFTRLNDWAAGLGVEGLFAHTGLFSQYVIGAAEMLAASLLLLGIVPALRRLQGLGALLGLAIMSGAVSFHLFTPLGTDPNNDGGLLFVMAVCVWVSCLIILTWRRKHILAVLCDMKNAVFAR
ncbi:MAG: hypothetical protein COA43_06155 [Robiginitomaculum sp.]|nr:MAG: hypothetical protein COA43_06155 [Robiginitomaculum sp.]